MCMFDDGDGIATVLSERYPRAVKQHCCSECLRMIELGEQYTVERLVFDGSARTQKTCAHCKVARDWLLEECRGFLYNGVAEDIQEHAINGEYGLRMRIIAVGIKRKWHRRDGGLYPIPKMPRLTPPSVKYVPPDLSRSFT